MHDARCAMILILTLVLILGLWGTDYRCSIQYSVLDIHFPFSPHTPGPTSRSSSTCSFPVPGAHILIPGPGIFLSLP